MLRKHLIACETERLKTKAITQDEMSRLIIATRGRERLNFDLIGRVIAEKMRRREQP